MRPTEAQWLAYYADLAKQCGGEIPIGYPAITTWSCECWTDNATVEGGAQTMYQQGLPYFEA